MPGYQYKGKRTGPDTFDATAPTPKPKPTPKPNPAPVHHTNISEVEAHIQNIRESRLQWEARLEELNQELEAEQRIYAELRAKQNKAEKRLHQRAEIIDTAHKLTQEIRAKYNDPPGEGRRRMQIFLREEDLYRAQKAAQQLTDAARITHHAPTEQAA